MRLTQALKYYRKSDYLNKHNYLAIDLGSKRIGLALVFTTEFSLPILDCLVVKGSLETSACRVLDWLEEHIQNLDKNSTIIVGNPLQLNGEDSKRSLISKNFCQKLEIELKTRGLNLSTNVVLWDERLSSVESELMINAHGRAKTKGEKRKKLKDQLSASLILESYLSGNLGN